MNEFAGKPVLAADESRRAGHGAQRERSVLFLVVRPDPRALPPGRPRTPSGSAFQKP